MDVIKRLIASLTQTRQDTPEEKANRMGILNTAKGVGNLIAPATIRGIENTVKTVPNLPDLFLGDENKKKQAIKNISGMDATPENAKAIMDQAQSNLGDAQKSKTELLSYFLPFGSGKNAAMKYLVPGALTGAAQANSTNTNPLMGAAGGAVGGGIVGGAGKILGKFGRVLGDKAQDINLRQFGITGKDISKLNKETGIDVLKLIKENDLFGRGIDDARERLGGLNEMYSEAISNPQFKADPRDLVMNLIKKGNSLKEMIPTAAQKLGQDVSEESTNLIKNIDMGNPMTGDTMRGVRKQYDKYLNPRNFSQNTEKAPVNKQIRDVLMDTINTAGDQLGIKTSEGKSIGETGKRISDLIKFIETVEPRANKGRGTLPLGLVSGLGASTGVTGGAVTGYQSEGVPGAIKGAAGGALVGAVLPNLVNNPAVIRALAGATSAVGNKLAGAGANNTINSLIQQLGARGGAAIPSMLGEQNDQGDNSAADAANNHASNKSVHNPNNIPQNPDASSEIDPNIEVTLEDGTKTTYGQLQQQGAFQTQEQSDSPISDDQFEQLFLADLIQNGGRNLDKLKMVQSLISPQEDIDTQLKKVQLMQAQKELQQGKPLTGESEKNALNAISGLRSTKAIEESLGSGGTEGLTQILPDFLGGDQSYQSSKTNLADVIGRLRSGGAIGVEEEKRFNKLLPSPTKSAETNKKDLAELKTLLGQFADPRKAQQTNEEFLQSYLGI